MKIHTNVTENFQHHAILDNKDQEGNNQKIIKNNSTKPIDSPEDIKDKQNLLSVLLTGVAVANLIHVDSKPELTEPRGVRTDINLIIKSIYDNNVNENQEKDYSTKDKYMMDKMAPMLASYLVALWYLVSNSVLQGSRMIMQMEMAIEAYKENVASGETKAISSFVSATTSMLIAGASTFSSIKSSTKHIKAESELADKTKLLQGKNIENNATINKNNKEINDINRSEKQRLKQDDKITQELNKDIHSLQKDNFELNNQHVNNENNIIKAKADGDHVAEEQFLKERRDLKDKMDANNESINQKETRLKNIEKNRDERQQKIERQVEKLEGENQRLRENIENNHMDIADYNHQQSVIRDELNKAHAISNAGLQMQRPISGLVEGNFEMIIAEHNAKMGMADKNSGIIAQNVRSIEDQARIQKEFMAILKKCMEEVLRGSDELKKTQIRA